MHCFCAMHGMELKMKKNKRNTKVSEHKEQAFSKAVALEKESNITLVSTSVAIVSFFLMLYVHNTVTTSFMTAGRVLGVIQILLLLAAVGCAVFAVWKKKTFLWEYVAFCAVMALGYYFLANPGITAFPFLCKEVDGLLYAASPFAQKLGEAFTTQRVIYVLWALNVIYGVLAIVLHSVKYSKIKKGSNK